MPIAAALPYLGAAAVGAGVGAAVHNQNKAAQTAAPNYGDEYAKGVQADLQSLVNRLQVSTAAEAGGVYTDPQTGQTYDFRGKFDPIRFAKDHPTALQIYADEQARGELQGWTPEMFAKAYLNDDATEMAKYQTGSPTYRNQTTIDTAKQLATAGDEITDASIRSQAKTLLELQPEFDALNRDAQAKAIDQMVQLMPKVGDAQRAQDAATYRQNADLGLEATQKQADLQGKIVPVLNNVSLTAQEEAFKRGQAASQTAFKGNLDQSDEAAKRAVAQQQQTLPQLNDLGIRLQTDAYKGADAAGRAVNGALYSLRDTYATQLADEMKSGADLTAAQRNRVQQRIRGAQASRGNILGDGAAFDEAIAESDYAQEMIDKRRSAALGILNARELSPNFQSIGVVNPTQVVSPNLQPANFTATTAVNPLLPNFGSGNTPNVGATTVNVPTNSTSTPIRQTDPLAMTNPNAGNAGTNYALNAWNALSNRIANAPNPWMQGLGAAFKSYATFGGG